MPCPISLRIGGDRTPVSVAQAHEFEQKARVLLSRLPDDSFVHTLDLSCRQWHVSALEAISAFLREISETVVICLFNDMIAGLKTVDGLATLAFLNETFQTAPLLKELCLDDNALGTRGVDTLRDLLSIGIERLYLVNTGMAEADAATLARILDPTHLKALAAGRNQMGVKGAEHIGALLANCLSLEYFSYVASRPLSEGTGALCNGLAEMSSTNTSLMVLNLTDCLLKSEDTVENLAFCLAKSPHLHTLILQDCDLSADGLKMILAALEGSGARLSVLNLSGNDQLGEASHPELSDMLSSRLSQSLVELQMETCELSTEGIASVMAPFTSNTSILQKLVLDGNEIDHDSGKAILNNYIPSLKLLSLRDNMDFPRQYAQQLKAMYPEVLVDEELEEFDEEEDDELAEALEGEEDDDVADDAEDDLAALSQEMNALNF